ncbi:MAG: hypothetical protein E6I64_03930, partial [Chloroflexi bacterium]
MRSRRDRPPGDACHGRDPRGAHRRACQAHRDRLRQRFADRPPSGGAGSREDRRPRAPRERDPARRGRAAPRGHRRAACRRLSEPRAKPRGDLPRVLLGRGVTLLRLALRLGRVGAIATGLIGAAGAIAQPLAFAQLRGDTPADQAVFAQQMEILARQLTYILPTAHDLGTMAGWIEWRAIGAMEIVAAVWALIAATGAGRGDEERGLLEHWLAQGVSRMRYIASRIAGFAVLGIVVSAVTLGAAGLGSALAKDPLPPGPLVLQAVALLGLVLCCYAIALLASQLVITRRSAVAVGGGVLLALYLVDVVARSDGAEAIRWISPFWLYDQNHPLTNGGALDVPRTIALYASGVAIAAAAVAAFIGRDLGGALLRRPPRDARPTLAPSRDPLLRVPVLALLDQQRTALSVWALVLAGLALFFLSFTRTLVDTMLATPTFRVYLERAGLASYTGFIGIQWFSTLVLLLSIYAI